MKLATDKTKIFASPFSVGCRRVKIGEDIFAVAPAGDAVHVLGLEFSLDACPSQQAKELIAGRGQLRANTVISYGARVLGFARFQ